MSFHPLVHLLQNGHLRWIWPEISLILDRPSLAVTLPTRIPLSTTVEDKKPIKLLSIFLVATSMMPNCKHIAGDNNKWLIYLCIVLDRNIVIIYETLNAVKRTRV